MDIISLPYSYRRNSNEGEILLKHFDAINFDELQHKTLKRHQ